MIDSYRINSLFDADVVDADGSKIGTVKHVYVDPDGGDPLFVGVTTGWFGRAESFVPLRDADFDGEVLHVEYDKDTVKSAPRIDADGTLTDDDIDRIQDHYGDGGRGEDDSRDAEDAEPLRPVHERGTAPDAARADEAADRADQRPPRRRIRVHRYVVTDERTGTAPPSSRDDGTLDRDSAVEQTRYETAEETRADRVDESRASSADERPRDLDGEGLRRRRE
ncbi:PRC-barrel domain-containing protein [Microbacterium esteraromaticum]|uniref:PRC-barrel domain-containing protein n=1 Tax=Microbacterium esteraromaticum TaxID=57043 RepID=UPI00195B0A58|nr:PRC-barrel domain-containing protein [Microbacterium esteraromaticum]MBM7467396.1 sporulation protein YlmC with PRC-barrel domain [Microbacterium esteraromaticum]